MVKWGRARGSANSGKVAKRLGVMWCRKKGRFGGGASYARVGNDRRDVGEGAWCLCVKTKVFGGMVSLIC